MKYVIVLGDGMADCLTPNISAMVDCFISLSFLISVNLSI